MINRLPKPPASNRTAGGTDRLLENYFAQDLAGFEGRAEPMTTGRYRGWRLSASLFAAIATDTVLQLMWKSAALDTAAGASPWATARALLSDPLILGILTIMTFQFFNWLAVLSQADLSYAKPVAALSYASVPVFSIFVLHERGDLVELGGVILIVAGVWFMSRTECRTKQVRAL